MPCEAFVKSDALPASAAPSCPGFAFMSALTIQAAPGGGVRAVWLGRPWLLGPGPGHRAAGCCSVLVRREAFPAGALPALAETVLRALRF